VLDGDVHHGRGLVEGCVGSYRNNLPDGKNDNVSREEKSSTFRRFLFVPAAAGFEPSNLRT
jgi:hypothetical protein